MLGDVFCLFVVVARGPINCELVLVYLVTNPVESHVDCLRSFVADASVGKSDSCCIVSFEEGGCLRVAKFFEGHLHGTCVSCY